MRADKAYRTAAYHQFGLQRGKAERRAVDMACTCEWQTRQDRDAEIAVTGLDIVMRIVAVELRERRLPLRRYLLQKYEVWLFGGDQPNQFVMFDIR